MKVLRILVLCGALGLSANVANAYTHESTEAGNNVVAYNTVYYGYSPYYYRHHVYHHPHHNYRGFIYVRPAYYETYGHHHRHHHRHHHGYHHHHHAHHGKAEARHEHEGKK